MSRTKLFSVAWISVLCGMGLAINGMAADDVELKVLFNGVEQVLPAPRLPGEYTVFARSASEAGVGAWSGAVTFTVKGGMNPGGNVALDAAPKAFKWDRVATATRYRFKLLRFDNKSGTYLLHSAAWVPQPAAGAPKLSPPANSIGIGKYLWTVTDYAGLTGGGTATAAFRVTTLSGSEYLVIDLSGGTGAASYPVSYLSGVPAGGWTDEYKTTKLVLRKILAKTFTMGSATTELGRKYNEKQHAVTLTKAFHIGVFEVTQRQWELVMGKRPSYFNNNTYYASRPVEQVSYHEIRENTNNTPISPNWPQSSAVGASSFVGKLRAKTGLSTIDLPTEAQWEHACRAKKTTALNSGKNLTATLECPNVAEVGRYWYNGGSAFTQNGTTSVGTAKVGSSLPNAWGLYDMHGNVSEWCLDWFLAKYPGPVSDPVGASSGGSRVWRGGSWYNVAASCRSAFRFYYEPAGKKDGIGFRIARTLP
jgi:formylglycine-generating enzyme required for sulfatase activity